MNRSIRTQSSKELKREHSRCSGIKQEGACSQMDLDMYAFSKQPGFVETEMRKAFKQAVPLRTVVVYCYDPRAANIPLAVAKAIPGEVYPGEIVWDEQGRKVA